MKNLKTILLLLAAIVAVSCSNSTETKAQNDQTANVQNDQATNVQNDQTANVQNDQATNVQNKQAANVHNPEIEEGKTIHMDKDMFIERVMDFETNKEVWKYIGDKPAIIDFYADWCKPCKLIAPIMTELADEYKGQIYVYKVDTQVERELASVFGIRSIPAVLFIPMKGQPQMSTGALPKETFKDAIDNFLLKSDEEIQNK